MNIWAMVHSWIEVEVVDEPVEIHEWGSEAAKSGACEEVANCEEREKTDEQTQPEEKFPSGKSCHNIVLNLSKHGLLGHHGSIANRILLASLNRGPIFALGCFC